MSNSMRKNGESQRPSPRTKHRRTAKGSTCTNCRQQKLKCDSANTNPEPCSRCQKSGVQCVVDPTYRRRGNREYTRSLEQEIQVLRGGPPTSGSSRADQSTEHMSFSDTSPPSVSPRFDHVCDQKLESVHLSSATILSLIERYYNKYHLEFPILPDFEVFILEYDLNRLLLWTVLAVASKGLEDQPSLFPALVDPVRKMAADLYAPRSRSFRTMQALLLLCVWPFPFQQTQNDPSPMYCSLATHIGYALGLHRPLHKADFDERAVGHVTATSVECKTWYGCFIVNQGVAMRHGIPTALIPGNALLSAFSYVEQSETSRVLLLELDLSLMFYQWLKILGDDDSTPSGQCAYPEHFMQAFDNQCSSLRAKHVGIWSPRLEMMFHTLQLQVYSFAIDRRHTLEASESASAAVLDVIIGKAVSSVVRLVSSVSTAEESRDYWPIFAKNQVMFAACVGLYMAATTVDISARSTLLQTCKDATSILVGWSMFTRDNIAIIGRHIATAIRRVESQGSKGLQAIDNGTHKTSINARIGTNIPFRIVWNAKHGKTPDSSADMQNTFPTMDAASTLPLIPTGQSTEPQNGPQPFDLLFNELNDLAFENMCDENFSDISLDWQSLRGMLPEWSQENIVC